MLTYNDITATITVGIPSIKKSHCHPANPPLPLNCKIPYANTPAYETLIKSCAYNKYKHIPYA